MYYTVDWFSWDYGMTDAGKPYRLFHYGYRGGTSRGRPGFTAIRINRADKNIATEQLKTLEEVVGIPVFVEDADMFSLMREEVPDSAGLSSEQLRNLPDFVRNFKCNGVVEKGEPYCEEEKYSSHLCQDREGKAPWHPGYKTHAMLGHSIALFLVEALASAIDDFLKYEFTDHHELLNRLTTEEESAYNTVINKTEDIQDFPSKLYSFDADEDLNASGLDPFLLFNGSSICHTARLPSRTRYLGYLTDTDKQGGPAIFGQEEYEVGTELDEAMKDFNETALQLVWEDDKFHQKDCPTIISPDHKDYFFTQAGRGWSELMFPNDAEKNAYRYDPTNHQGLMILVFRKCDWGQCEEGYLGAEDLTEEKEWEMKINGEPVVKLIDIGHLAFIAKGKNGMKFTPNEAGTYKIEIQVNEPSHFVKISSFVIY